MIQTYPDDNTHMKKKELVLVECPECKGLGDVPFYTWEGDKDWDVCHVCKGEKKILTKKVKTSWPVHQS